MTCVSQLNHWNHLLALALAFSETNNEIRTLQGTGRTPLSKSGEHGTTDSQERADTWLSRDEILKNSKEFPQSNQLWIYLME